MTNEGDLTKNIELVKKCVKDNSVIDSYIDLNKNNKQLKLFLSKSSRIFNQVSKTSLKKMFAILLYIQSDKNISLSMIEDEGNLIFDSFIEDIVPKSKLNRVSKALNGESNKKLDKLYSYSLSSSIATKFKEFIKYYMEEEKSSIMTDSASNLKYSNTFSFKEYNESIPEQYEIHNIINGGIKKEDINDFEDDYIMPKPSYNLNNFIKNLQQNSDVEHLFNFNMDLSDANKSSSTGNLTRVKVRINNQLTTTKIAIEHSIMCPSCGVNKKYTLFDLAGKITCDQCDTTLKISSGVSKPSIVKEIYEYDYSYWDNTESCWKDATENIFSIVELERSVVEVEFVNIATGGSTGKDLFTVPINLIIAKNPKFNSARLDYKIIDTSYIPKKISVVEFIYDQLMLYLQKEHGLKISNQHKIPNIVGLFASLSNFFHDIKMLVVVAGYSGSGKSFFIENIVPLLHKNSTVVSGPNVSKSKYIGGNAEKVSSIGVTGFGKGVVGTNSMVCVEEFTNVINDFIINPRNRTANLFSMEKEINDSDVKATTHGTKQYPLTASRFFAGNLENLEGMTAYRETLKQEYRKIDNTKLFDSKLPLYRPIEWYAKYINRELAQAHYNIRSGNLRGQIVKISNIYWDFSNNHYIFHLPPAEMARLHYCFFLEKTVENKRVMKKKPEAPDFTQLQINDKVEVTSLHTSQLREELNNIFTSVKVRKLNKDEMVKYGKFFWDIEQYIDYEFLQKRNNHIFGNEDLNTQVIQRLKTKAKSFMLFEKQMRNEPYELTEHDKKLFEEIELYNYNSLNSKEAAKESIPCINDAYDFDESMVIKNNFDLKEEEEREEEEDKEGLSQMVRKTETGDNSEEDNPFDGVLGEDA